MHIQALQCARCSTFPPLYWTLALACACMCKISSRSCRPLSFDSCQTVTRADACMCEVLARKIRADLEALMDPADLWQKLNILVLCILLNQLPQSGLLSGGGQRGVGPQSRPIPRWRSIGRGPCGLRRGSPKCPIWRGRLRLGGSGRVGAAAPSSDRSWLLCSWHSGPHWSGRGFDHGPAGPEAVGSAAAVSAGTCQPLH